jgi:hypothetical protein
VLLLELDRKERIRGVFVSNSLIALVSLGLGIIRIRSVCVPKFCIDGTWQINQLKGVQFGVVEWGLFRALSPQRADLFP